MEIYGRLSEVELHNGPRSLPRSKNRGSRYFTKLDLNTAYYQVPVAPEDVPKTTVTTPFGLFEFVGMPLGLRNATQTFQRYMDSLFRDLPFV